LPVSHPINGNYNHRGVAELEFISPPANSGWFVNQKRKLVTAFDSDSRFTDFNRNNQESETFPGSIL